MYSMHGLETEQGIIIAEIASSLAFQTQYEFSETNTKTDNSRKLNY